MRLRKTVKRGDTADPITIQAYYQDSDLTPLFAPLSTPVTFSMSTLDGDLVIDRASAAVIDDGGEDGILTTIYQWQAGDTDAAGTYHAEFEYTLSNGKFTLPENGYLIIDIQDDLA